ncbi:glycine oxidase maturase GoxB [Microvirga puerhi]|uniref:Glycine oxidase maturase GoxB n=1 Tax=Microvirga puerhi TaxID=2876078 RepID=A0ABS7VV36_9HYPH|nr:glycine oxidase maturase GoxB [Microvirga puerhi]MBZ6078985.1 glycine oxidase maturase GoxB [Microvirga puerhi]
MRNATVPVAVLGGGIAGAAACITLAAAGLRPLWIAPLGRGGDKPGEHLAPAAWPLLSKLGSSDLVARSYHRPAGITFSSWGSDHLAERHSMVHLEGPATVLNRMRFEADLADRALNLDVERISAPVAQVSRQDDVWHLQVGDTRLRTFFLLDATGRTAFVARSRASRFRADRLAALVGFLEQDPQAEVVPTRATLVEATASGWWYVTLLADDRLALNHYTDPDLIPFGSSKAQALLDRLSQETRYVGRWIDEAGFRFVTPIKATSAGTTWVAPAAGIGWAAIGDAAAAFDPLSSHGMTTALWTAIAGAEASVAALSGDLRPLAAYATKVATGVQEFLSSQREIYRREQRFLNEPFWKRRHSQHASNTLQDDT